MLLSGETLSPSLGAEGNTAAGTGSEAGIVGIAASVPTGKAVGLGSCILLSSGMM